MAKVAPLNQIESLANTASAKQALNENFEAIEAAFVNTLSRDGSTPNQMEADIDLNSNDLLNVGTIDANQILHNGVPIEQEVAYGSVVYLTEDGNGSQTNYPLAVHPGSLGNLEVSVDGEVLRPGLDYNLVGSELVFVVAPASGTDNILIRYAIALPLGTLDANSVLYEVPSSGDGTSVGAFLDLLDGDDGADNVGYTPTSTGIVGTIKTFLDSLWSSTSGKGSDLIAFPDTMGPAYLKTTSDMINGLEVSIDRFITKSKLPAIRNGTSVDILTAHIQEAADAFDSLGYGNLYLPRGRYNLDDDVLLAFNGNVRGDGVGATVIRLMTADQNGFVVPYSGYVHFRDLEFTAGVVKTDGAGIRVEGLGGSASSQTRIERCRFQEQYYGIDMANAGYWTISRNGFFESVQAGIRVDNTQNYDAGDNLIIANVIQKTALTAGSTGVLHVASGGTKLIGNKILGHDRGYTLIPRAGALSVIDTQIVGNSIEDGNTAIFIQTAVAGTSVGQMTLNSNQMSNKTNGIVIIGAAAGVTINDNQIAVNFANHIGIYLDSGNGSPSQVIVSDNQISGNSSASSIGIYGGNLANVKLTDNQITGCASPYSTVANTIMRGFELPFALLPAAGNGSYGYVSDGTVANPVAGGGTGCFAKRLNGVWVGN